MIDYSELDAEDKVEFISMILSFITVFLFIISGCFHCFLAFFYYHFTGTFPEREEVLQNIHEFRGRTRDRVRSRSPIDRPELTNLD